MSFTVIFITLEISGIFRVYTAFSQLGRVHRTEVQGFDTTPILIPNAIMANHTQSTRQTKKGQVVYYIGHLVSFRKL